MADKKRVYREITKEEDLEEIWNLDSDHAGEKSLLMNWFADFGKGPRFNPYDIVSIKPGCYGLEGHKNKNTFKTTVGRWAFNKGIIEPVSNVLGYVNKTVTKGVYKDLNKQLSYALLEEKITLEHLKDFIMQVQMYMGCASAICPSHTEDMILFTDKATKKRDQLYKENQKAIEAGDLTAMKKVEDTLISYAKEELKDSPSVDMYNSGARGGWGNNFKNMYLVKGVVTKTDGSYKFIKTSHIEGINKDEFVDISDAAIEGPYSRANKTREGGYLEKQFTNALQHIKILGKGTDCGSTRTVPILLTKKNINDWIYCFVRNPNGSLTEITTETKDKFIGKTVNLRFSALCKSKNGICEACAGTMFRRVGIINAGLAGMILASDLKNKSMAAMHDSTLKLTEINVDRIFD